MTAPDFFEPIVGWRMWRYTSSGFQGNPDVRLVSPCRGTTNDGYWWPMRRFEASCGITLGLGPVPHPRVDQWHLCGAHAARTIENLFRFSGFSCSERFIYGQVSLWGRVIQGERGYRAQFAYPRVFYVPDAAEAGPHARDEFPSDVLPAWGVPVVRVPTARDIEEE